MSSTPATATFSPNLVHAFVASQRDLPAPRATYRLQFNHTFTFNHAAAIVPYLSRLGISHVYASPIFKAAQGSMHGYDVADYGQLNPTQLHWASVRNSSPPLGRPGALDLAASLDDLVDVLVSAEQHGLG